MAPRRPTPTARRRARPPTPSRPGRGSPSRRRRCTRSRGLPARQREPYRPVRRRDCRGTVRDWTHDLRRLRPPAPRHRSGRDRRSGSTASTPSSTPTARPAPASCSRKLLERARESQVSFPATVSHARTSTPSPARQEPWFPGDEYIERRIRAFIRWNAAVMVVKANKHADGIGGHLVDVRQLGRRSTRSASTTSSAARTTATPATTSTSRATPPPASTPGRSSRAASTEDDLDHFRREIGRGGTGLSSYPHPRLMPDFWEFPTVSMGLGPITAIYQARFNRYLHNRQIDDTSQSRVWCFLGDGECDEPETLGAHLAGRPRAARQPDLRRQLQPAAPRRPGARQRQDHPGARGHLPRRRLERHQGHLGLEVGRAARQGQGRRAAQQDEHHRRRRVPALRASRPAPTSATTSSAPTRGCAQMVAAPHRRRPAQPAPRRPRLPQALRRLQGGHREPRHRARPTVILPRRSRAGRSARASRAATPPTRSRR